MRYISFQGVFLVPGESCPCRLQHGRLHSGNNGLLGISRKPAAHSTAVTIVWPAGSFVLWHARQNRKKNRKRPTVVIEKASRTRTRDCFSSYIFSTFLAKPAAARRALPGLPSLHEDQAWPIQQIAALYAAKVSWNIVSGVSDSTCLRLRPLHPVLSNKWGPHWGALG